jgi:hypothetical protein
MVRTSHGGIQPHQGASCHGPRTVRDTVAPSSSNRRDRARLEGTALSIDLGDQFGPFYKTDMDITMKCGMGPEALIHTPQ